MTTFRLVKPRRQKKQDGKTGNTVILPVQTCCGYLKQNKNITTIPLLQLTAYNSIIRDASEELRPLPADVPPGTCKWDNSANRCLLNVTA